MGIFSLGRSREKPSEAARPQRALTPVVVGKTQPSKIEPFDAGEKKPVAPAHAAAYLSVPGESTDATDALEQLGAANDDAPKQRKTENNTDKPKNYATLEDLASLGAYRGQVPGIVGKAGQSKCVVVDMGYNTVSILCIPEFAHTGQYAAIRYAVESRSLTVVNECLVTPELLDQVVTDIQRRSQRAAVTVSNGTSEEMRNLALFIELVAGAWQLGATDIHVVLVGRTSSTSLVRLRIDGRMSDWKSFPSKTLLAALAAGYSSLSVAGTNSDPDWAPSKACSTITHHEVLGADGRRRSISGRFTSRPTVDSGCKVAIRLLDTDVRDVRIPSLAELGYEHSHVEEQLTPALQKNQGLILFAGGTGSGKSTVLRTAMHILPDKESLERYSVEDPVEYVLPGVIQLSIQRGSDESEEKTRLKFTAALRDLMRMDPDAVMIGEIRDGETARLATEMVNTGHRVLSTVHGNSNIDVLARLTGATLGVSSSTLASDTYLLCVVYQKLLPKLCPSCKRPAKSWLTPHQLKAVVQRFGLDPATLFVANPDGCEDCNLPEIAPSGTRGLTVVAEVMTPDRHILDFIRQERWNDARDYWRRQRRTRFGDPDMTGKTAFEHAIYKMSRGLVSINDIERDFEPLATYPLMDLEAAHALE